VDAKYPAALCYIYQISDKIGQITQYGSTVVYRDQQPWQSLQRTDATAIRVCISGLQACILIEISDPCRKQDVLATGQLG